MRQCTSFHPIGIYAIMFFSHLDTINRKDVNPVEIRKIFDTIPETFDKYRSCYCPELFDDLIAYANLGPGKTVLELGPGTGQATEPVLNTGCDYYAIELGENLYRKMQDKFSSRPKFHITNDDFITHSFGDQRFDLIYSAATIQWIPEEIAFSKTFELLKPGGTLAMLLTRGDYRTPNPALHARIQEVYRQHFKPETSYPCRGFGYANAPQYGYEAFEQREYPTSRIFTADEYVGYCGTHCDHIALAEPGRSLFFGGIRQAVLDAGDRLESIDTHVLYLTRKPL